jgi:hypothetical protein
MGTSATERAGGVSNAADRCAFTTPGLSSAESEQRDARVVRPGAARSHQLRFSTPPAGSLQLQLAEHAMPDAAPR